MKTTALLLGLLFLFFQNTLFAQDFAENGWEEDILAEANTASQVEYLTEDEKKIIWIMNLARLRPALFAQTIEDIWKNSSSNDFGQTDNLGKNKWFQSLLNDLRNAKPMPALLPEAALCTVAARHAEQMGKIGQIGHQSPDGTTFDKRIRQALPKAGWISENCDYGNKLPIDIVMSLLVDENVPSFGHRKNILNPVYKRIGIGIKPHKKYETNCVMDFAD